MVQHRHSLIIDSLQTVLITLVILTHWRKTDKPKEQTIVNVFVHILPEQYFFKEYLKSPLYVLVFDTCDDSET